MTACVYREKRRVPTPKARRWSELSEAEQAAWMKRVQAFLDSDVQPMGPRPRAFWYGIRYESKSTGRLTRYPRREGQPEGMGVVELPEVKP